MLLQESTELDIFALELSVTVGNQRVADDTTNSGESCTNLERGKIN